jgi:hypothetical protein
MGYFWKSVHEQYTVSTVIKEYAKSTKIGKNLLASPQECLKQE